MSVSEVTIGAQVPPVQMAQDQKLVEIKATPEFEKHFSKFDDWKSSKKITDRIASFSLFTNVKKLDFRHREVYYWHQKGCDDFLVSIFEFLPVPTKLYADITGAKVGDGIELAGPQQDKKAIEFQKLLDQLQSVRTQAFNSSNPTELAANLNAINVWYKDNYKKLMDGTIGVFTKWAKAGKPISQDGIDIVDDYFYCDARTVAIQKKQKPAKSCPNCEDCKYLRSLVLAESKRRADIYGMLGNDDEVLGPIPMLPIAYPAHLIISDVVKKYEPIIRANDPVIEI